MVRRLPILLLLLSLVAPILPASAADPDTATTLQEFDEAPLHDVEPNTSGPRLEHEQADLSPIGHQDRGQVASALRERLEDPSVASSGRRLRVIVSFRADSRLGSDMPSDAQSLQQMTVARLSRLGDEYPTNPDLVDPARTARLSPRGFGDFPAMVLSVTPAQIEEIARLPFVRYVEEDVASPLPSGHAVDGDSLPPQLDLVPELIGADPVTFSYGAASLTGSGYSVAIFDTGIDKGHPFFRSAEDSSRVTLEICSSSIEALDDGRVLWDTLCTGPGTPEPEAGAVVPVLQVGPGVADDCAPSIGDRPVLGCGHGTHVAGIAAGTPTNVETWAGPNVAAGVAIGADIISVQVFSRVDCSLYEETFDVVLCDEETFGVRSFTSDRIAAFLEVIDAHEAALEAPFGNGRPVAAINMSLGGGGLSTPCTSATAEWMSEEMSAEEAAANLAREAGIAVVASAGNNGYRRFIGYPACLPAIVSVGSSNQHLPPESVSDYSNVADFVDLLAPAGGCFFEDPFCPGVLSAVPGGGWASKIGTSMAAPQVAGAFAVLREQNPDRSVDELLGILTGTGRLIADLRTGAVISPKPRLHLGDAVAFAASDGALFVPSIGTQVWKQGRSVDLQLAPIGGQMPVTWSLTGASDPLPSGVSFSTSGQFSGVPLGRVEGLTIEVSATDFVGSSMVRRFDLDVGPLGAPWLSEPEWFGETSSRPTFRWYSHDAEPGEQHRLRIVDPDGTLTDLLLEVDTTCTNGPFEPCEYTLLPEQELAPGNHEWKVRLEATPGIVGEWSWEREFTVSGDSGSDVPGILWQPIPASGPFVERVFDEATSPTFEWTIFGTSDRFRFEVGVPTWGPSGLDGFTPVLPEWSIPTAEANCERLAPMSWSCSYTPDVRPEFPSFGTLHWRARSETNAGSAGDWSFPSSFELVPGEWPAVAQRPSPVLPERDAQVGSRPTFRWRSWDGRGDYFMIELWPRGVGGAPEFDPSRNIEYSVRFEDVCEEGEESWFWGWCEADLNTHPLIGEQSIPPGLWFYFLSVGFDDGFRSGGVGQPIQVLSPINPVRSLNIRSVAGSVSASWSAPIGAPATGVTYDIESRARASTTDAWSDWASVSCSNPSATSCQISSAGFDGWGLETQVRARAVVGGGPSAWVESGLFTPFTVPDVSGVDVGVVPGNRVLTVSWDPQMFDRETWIAAAGVARGADVSRVEVRASTVGLARVVSRTCAVSRPRVGAFPGSCVVSGLVNDQLYVVEVRAQNRAGWSEWVPVPVLEDARTPVPVAPSVVRSLRVQEVAGALRVTWAGPAADGGAPPEFDVQVRRVDNDGEWATACADLGARTLVCQIGADAIGDGWGELHEVRVRARNSQGASDWVVSGPGLFTPFTVPDVSGVDVGVVPGNRVLTVSWDPQMFDRETWIAAAGVARGADVSRVEVRASTVGLARVVSRTCAVSRPRVGAFPGSCVVSGLVNDQLYVVEVRAQNRAGWSEWVPVPVLEDARTPVPVAPSVVRSLRVQEVAGALRVTWAGPAADGGAPPEFDVQVRRVDNDGEWATACADLGARTLVCQIGADAIGDGWGELHEVRVRARNSQGASDWVVSGPGLFTPFTVPDVSGVDVGVVPGNRVLTVSWDPQMFDRETWIAAAGVARGADVSRVEVRASTVGLARVVSRTCAVSRPRVGAFPGSCVVSGLVNDQLYVVEVRAQNRAGWSEWVPVPVLEDARTPVPVAPSVVRSLRVQEVAGALRVTWAGPAADGGAPPEFDVQVRRVDNDGEWATACADLGARTLVCQIGADAIGDGWGELHEVRVRARNSQGASDWVVSGPGLFTPFTVPDVSGVDVGVVPGNRVLTVSWDPQMFDRETWIAAAGVARGADVSRVEVRASTVGLARVVSRTCAVSRPRVGAFPGSCVVSGAGERSAVCGGGAGAEPCGLVGVGAGAGA
jgi:subtilisin family serine protease